MKKITVFLMFFFKICVSQEESFEKHYSSDYIIALQKVQGFQYQFDSICKSNNTPSKEVLSMVFPEMVRYSYLSDISEVAMLELFYIEKGSTKYSNFSVGLFQMKPSFIEGLEKEISSSKSLKKKYKNLLINDTISDKAVRKIRLSRLKNIQYQICYASCFYEIAVKKFSSDSRWKKANLEERLRIISTSYNSGLNISYDYNLNMQKIKLFPEGKICFDCHNYNYSDVVVEFYRKLAK